LPSFVNFEACFQPMNFFKTFLTSCLGTFTALLLITILGILAIFSLSASEDVVTVADNSVLELNLSGRITELEIEDPLGAVIPEAAEESIGLIQLIETIEKAATDEKIKGIFLHTSDVAAGTASVEEIREALENFKKSGKWLVSYADGYSERAYYLSSVADTILLNPHGMVEFNGLTAEVMFFKKAMDKLEIKPEVFRVGDFKSAVEPFLREDLSPENELQLKELLNDVHRETINKISVSRGIKEEELKRIADKMLVRNAQQAVEFKLVDQLMYEDQVHDLIRQKLSLEKDKRISFVRYDKYRKTKKEEQEVSRDEISVIVADGEIMPGKADNGVIGSKTFVEALRRARKTERVKAVVLRINSPGGSFTASDDIWREIKNTAAEKPVIASMSDYAASGGYFLAMACDSIVARPTTITGSIGVFSVLFDLSGFLGNKIGITSDEVRTGEVGELITFTRPLSEQEREIWQTQTNEVYDIFISKAAAGRKMSQDSLRKIASGRVWTGNQALSNGLIDAFGGLKEATAIAATKAGLSDGYKVNYYPKPKNFLEKVLSGDQREVDASDILSRLGFGPGDELLKKQWLKLKSYAGKQARMSTEFEIH